MTDKLISVAILAVFAAIIVTAVFIPPDYADALRPPAPMSNHIPMFGGDIFYIDADDGDDLNTGRNPDEAFATIGQGITAMGDGDALSIKSGTYTETGLDLSNDGAEMWFDISAIVDPVSGTALTVSGDNCRVYGDVKITPAAAAIGLLVSGTRAVIEGGLSIEGGAIGIQVTGDAATLDNCFTTGYSEIGFDLQADGARVIDSRTVGADTDTYGYLVTDSADRGIIKNSSSNGNATAGYYIGSGSNHWQLLNNSTGAGDGRWVDVDTINLWANFSYDAEIHNDTIFDGDGPDAKNIFQITGTVEIRWIFGDVETILSADVDDIYLALYDGTNTIEITDDLGGGVDTDSADVGSTFVKIAPATVVMSLLKNDQARVGENVNFREPRSSFIVEQKKDTATYIRVVYDGVATSGAIHWHCRWVPLTENGFLSSL